MKLEATLPSWATFVSLRRGYRSWIVELRSTKFPNIIRQGRGETEDAAQLAAEEALLISIHEEEEWREENVRLAVEDVEDLL